MDRLSVLLLAAAVALAVSVGWNLALPQGGAVAADGPAPAAASPAVEGRLAKLEQRLQELERQATRPRRAGAATDPGPQREVVLSTAGDGAAPVAAGAAADLQPALQQLDARLARLEALQQAVDEDQARREAERARRLLERQQAVANAPGVILDPTQTAAAKAEAWENLRRADASTWTDAVVAEMVRVAQTSDDPEIRADIWRCADADRAHPLLKQPLLDAVLRDTDTRVREEAAETLENYVDDPAVVAILERIIQSDASPEVREEARRALERGRRGR